MRPKVHWLASALLCGALVVQGCGGPTKRLPPAPRFSNAEIEASYKNGEEALLNGDYVKARRVLMQIISRFPGENDLAQVQWLMAKTYDMENRPVEAVAEYKRFVANYPDHPNAQDADDRIRHLEQAARPKPSKPVRVVGSLSTDYEYAEDLSPEPLTTLNRVTTRLDAQIRNLDEGRGKVVVSALRSFDLQDQGDDRARLQKLYGDWRNPADRWSVRIGRQPSTPGALSTRYDGAELHYRVIPTVAFDVAAGFPVDFFRSGALSTDARFYEAGLTAADVGGATGRIYAIRQFAEDVLDREAVGGNFQGGWGRFGANGNADYDINFGEFNDRFLSIEYALRESLTVTLARDARNDPYLQMSTALLDDTATAATPPITTVSDLLALAGQNEDTVRDMARNHTIDSTDSRVGLRWTIGPHWLSTADYSHTVSQIPQAGGGRTRQTFDRVSLYAAQSNAWRFPDTTSALIIHQTGSELVIDTVSLVAGERLAPSLLLQLKARVEYTGFKNGSATDSIRYVPGVALNMEPTRFLLLTAEGEYTHENRFYMPGRTAILSRLNVTVLF
ncbi:MAG: outer membrane protein assembly factor BamD [Nitrospirota bacterium]